MMTRRTSESGEPWGNGTKVVGGSAGANAAVFVKTGAFGRKRVEEWAVAFAFGIATAAVYVKVAGAV